MPDSPLTPIFTSGRDDVALIDALTIIRVVMDAVVNASPPMLSDAVRERCIETWPDVLARIEDVTARIRGAALADPPLGPKLEQVGLTGSPLALKVAGIKNAFGRWLRGAGGFFRRYAHSFFNWSNTLLGSLAEALGPAGDFIKEFKECLENDLEDQELESAHHPS